MKLCRFLASKEAGASASVGLLTSNGGLIDLSQLGHPSLAALLESDRLTELLQDIESRNTPQFSADTVRLLAPIEKQEVWAAGVTYLRSKTARMEESNFSATAYDRVYDAERPELFFKSIAEKVVGSGDAIGVRSDSRWTVPEPELALVFNSKGKAVGFTIGNDVSARDIEGENLLYLPQAKIYSQSCALGPCIRVGASEAEARTWRIGIQILRAEKVVFEGETTVQRLKRSFEELSAFLFRSQQFPHGSVLLTGTGVVPPDDFSLIPGDLVRIDIRGVGRLENTVVAV